jgi:hypothetical protein
MMRLAGVFCVLAVFSASLSTAGVNTAQSQRESAIRVPFRLDRSKVIIPTSVNGSAPLNLILDTGMRFDGVYLFHAEFADQMDTTGAAEYLVPGAGSGEPTVNLMIENGTLTFGTMSVDSQRILISKSTHTQSFPTDGVIGWNLFGHYVVEIDYDSSMIFLHDTLAFRADSTWTEVSVVMKKDLPFLEVELEVVAGETVPITVYVDLASSDALELLVSDSQVFSMPDNLTEQYLGTGLSGDIYGHRGRIERLSLAGHDFCRVGTAFALAEVRSKQEGADGILGNELLRRFNLIFDYPRSRMLFKSNSHTNEPFD